MGSNVRLSGFCVVITISLMMRFALCQTVEDALIDTGDDQLGKIQGSIAWTSKALGETGRKYFWFTGIPYAKPDSYTGENRFKPSELWDGKLPVDETGNGAFLANEDKAFIYCPQMPVVDLGLNLGEEKNSSVNYVRSNPVEIFRSYYSRDGRKRRKQLMEEEDGKLWGQEDCLIVTVSTPKLPSAGSTEKLPVIVFIHGGGFDAFWGSVFGGQRLLNHDVVLVSMNYRLGILSSLNLGIEDAPGNLHMYDCINALKWVQKYIHHFGGDRDRVTLSGQSAGAVLGTALFMSPLAKGLFHGVIGDSGSAYSIWASEKNPIQENLKFISFTNCRDLIPPNNRLPDDDEAKAIRDCMKDLTLWELVSAREKYGASENFQARMGYNALVPSVQKASLARKIELALDATPREIIKNKRQSNVPLIMGATRHDGSFVLMSTFYDYLVANGLDSDAEFIKNDLFPQFLKGVGLEDPTGALIHALERAYLGDAMNSDDIVSKIPGLLDLHTALGFKAGAYNLVEDHAKLNKNSYYYAFDYKGMATIYNIAFGLNLIPGGIAHVDDLLFLFQIIPLLTKQDWEVSNRWVQYWANFAIYGNPNGPGDLDEPFPRYNPLDHRFIIINATDRIGYHCRDTWYGNSDELIH